MLLEPDKPKTKWHGILIGHGILYTMLVAIIALVEVYFYNAGDAVIVSISAVLLTLFSYMINRTYLRKKALLLTLFISPGTLLLFFIMMINLLLFLSTMH